MAVEAAAGLGLPGIAAHEDLVEQGGAEEKALLVARDFLVASVEHQLRAFGHAGVDIPRDLVAVGRGDERPHFHAFAVAGTDLDFSGLVLEQPHQGIADRAHPVRSFASNVPSFFFGGDSDHPL